MVERAKRTRSTKKVKVKTPGARTVTHFRGERSGRPTCGLCMCQLSGVMSGTQSAVRNLPKSSKVPARPYAGQLCTNCLDRLVRYVTRMEVKAAVPEYANLNIQRDLELEKFLPRGWHEQVAKGYIKKASRKTFKKGGAKPAEKKAQAKPKKKAPAKAKPKAKA